MNEERMTYAYEHAGKFWITHESLNHGSGKNVDPRKLVGSWPGELQDGPPALVARIWDSYFGDAEYAEIGKHVMDAIRRDRGAA